MKMSSKFVRSVSYQSPVQHAVRNGRALRILIVQMFTDDVNVCLLLNFLGAFHAKTDLRSK